MRVIKYSALCMCVLLIGAVFFSNSVGDGFTLSLRRGDNMVYEYNIVNTTLIQNLEEEDEFYKSLSLSSVKEHSRIKLKVDEIVDYEDQWEIVYQVYNASHQNEFLGYVVKYCAKLPEVFVYEIYSGSYFDVIPTNVQNFLLQSNSLQIEIHNDSSIIIGDHSVIFDYTILGRNDTIVFLYNQYGILEKYSLLFDNQIAFEKTLISFSVENDNQLFIIIVSIVSVSIIAGTVVILYLIKKRKKEKSKTKKLLKHIR